MERLQAAIEKARAQRARPGVADQSQTVAPSPQKPAAQAGQQTETSTTTDPALWAELEEFKPDADQMKRNRITAYMGGVDSAPFDLLRTRMLQQARQKGWRRVALVSPHADCGKSTTAANLAFSLARQKSLHSIVFDFDLRRSGLSRIMGQRLPASVSEVLRGEIPFSEQARRFRKNVAFGFHNGTKVANPSEVLQSPETTRILNEISDAYAPDVMLFDMPPIMASDDNFGFLQNVDCAIIMVTAEKTPISQIDVAERHVAELTNVMGVVLNKCRYTSGAHGHEYEYY